MNGQKRQIYEFDNFRLDAGERQFLRDGKPVTLSSRAFDLLLVLVENNGRLIEKEELYSRVWHNRIVEDSNLSVQMSAIRKALGERRGKQIYIGTVIGSGYRFTADVRMPDRRAGDELIIESESIERVVIEREEIRDGRSRAKFVESSQIDSASGLPSRPVNRKFVLLITLLIGGLLASGFGGYWFYRNRSPESSVNTPSFRQTMTITRITDGRQLGAPAISPDGKFIAYVENTFVGAGTLFLQQIDTNTVLQLLEPAERTFGCTNFSPDGALIYYVVFDKRDPGGALYSLPVLGGVPKRLFGNFSACFTVSPDGKRVAFYRGDPKNNQTSLMIAALDGSGEQALLTRNRDEWSHTMSLAWSPDGNLIAIFANLEVKNPDSNAAIYGVDAHDGTLKPLTAENFSSLGKISWTADGRNLVFVAKRPRGENKVFLMDYPSGEVRQITNDLESYGNYGLGIADDSGTLVADIFETKSEIWSVEAGGNTTKAVRLTNGTTDGRGGIAALPDGRLAYTALTSNSLEIRTAQKDGADAKALTTDSFTQKDVAASPDGRFLVFASDQAGESHIFRMNAADGSETTQLTFGATVDSQPNISPDGNWIIYTSRNGKQSTIWKIPLEGGGAAVQLTDYESGSPVFSPDGKTIACVLPSNSRAMLGSIAVIPGEGGKPFKWFRVMPFAYSYQTIHWTPDGQAVVFVKGEKGVFNLWQQPVSGSAAQQLTDFPSGAIWNFAYSSDGKRLFISRGSTFVDIVLIKNFR